MARQIPEDYHQRRAEIYHPLREEGIFTWDQDAVDHEEYGLATIHPVTREFIKEVRHATEQLGHIFARVIPVVQQGADELLRELGIPENAWSAVRQSFDPSIATVIGRLDFANTPDGLKLLEFNADTPGGFVEAYHVNQWVCDYYGWENPNAGRQRDIKTTFQSAVHKYQKLGYHMDRKIFSSKPSIEETALTRFLLAHSGLEAEYIPLADHVFHEGQLCMKNTNSGSFEPIDLWYRFYALTSIAAEKSANGQPIGTWLLQAAANRKIAMINPPQAFIAQTKALMALIWNLHEEGAFFTKEENEIISKYMIPTYMENVFRGKEPFVEKPVLGRQGGSVTMYAKDGTIIAQDDEGDFWEQTMVYQKLVELETIETMSLEGAYKGWLVWGCFLMNGQASAVTTRLSEEITQDSCRFLPIGYAK
ncbi:Glutathionylspermidine synthase [Seinonella peptonophila]|uniref:Glutathionylspermidine synthase n=1 Tax=Seinonella peptonophila TaxID=112248 RepID=A0A1M4XX09_9BACL|nr:glutathionylspermidine synthase family protein [Seinonella peptonophila]SHE97970.1 Glutathionylspermidine synthase [Seinonella peptonophila]